VHGNHGGRPVGSLSTNKVVGIAISHHSDRASGIDALAKADAELPATAKRPPFRAYPVGWVHRGKKDLQGGSIDTWTAMSFAPHN
jgi:hypothetical protein